MQHRNNFNKVSMPDLLTESYAVWSSSDTAESSFARQLDSVLDGFVYYPDEEWATFEYRPPEDADLLGAWRNREGSAFVFLLSGSVEPKKSLSPTYRVLITGATSAVRQIGEKVAAQKSTRERIEKKEIAERVAGDYFTAELNSRSIERFSAIVAIFTVIVNAFSLYLRALPEPKIQDARFLIAYQWLLACVHVGALLLLLVAIGLAIAYLLKFGILLVGRRR
jgi:hypothetical protein